MRCAPAVAIWLASFSLCLEAFQLNCTAIILAAEDSKNSSAPVEFCRNLTRTHPEAVLDLKVRFAAEATSHPQTQEIAGWLGRLASIEQRAILTAAGLFGVPLSTIIVGRHLVDYEIVGWLVMPCIWIAMLGDSFTS